MASEVPATTIQAILASFRALGFDEQRLRAEARVPAQLDGGVLVPDVVRRHLWAGGYREARRAELAIEAGLAVPFGALGPMDYLATSADTLGASCDALMRQFRTVSWERSLEIEQHPGDYRVKLVVVDTREDTLAGDEFTLGAMVGRFRAHVDGFSIAAVQLKRPPPKDPERFAALFGAPVSFGHAVSALCLPGRLRDAPLSSSDPWLTRALESLLPQSDMHSPESTLERSLRKCLRELLPRGRLGAAAVAGALGMSERSLHRRLRELGQSYQVVVDVFRREEAERLLLHGRIDMTEIAARLGFADQSAFSRAFRRWTQMAPRAWLAHCQFAAPAASHADFGRRGRVTVSSGRLESLRSASR
jgi:AraC-like DNA-binding protein